MGFFFSFTLQTYQVAYVIVKAAISPRPGNWILERSLDGRNYEPWQFYATSTSECLDAFRIYGRDGKPVFNSDDEVTCTSYYSKLYPLEGGEVIFVLNFLGVSAATREPETL